VKGRLLNSRESECLQHRWAKRGGKNYVCARIPPELRGLQKFINAHMIALGMSPFAPESAAIRAGRLMLEEIELSAGRGIDFGFETTLSGRSHLGVIRRLKKRGYCVHFFYLWVPSVELTLARISERVLRGGRDVPEEVVRRRFDRSITNFLKHCCALGERWVLFDASTTALSIVATEEQGRLRLLDTKLYNEIVARYGNS
jgi:predicted ABC-type ATPase